jgi:hypothetical protein
LKLLGRIIVPAEHWFGSELHSASIGSAQTQRDATPAFSTHRSAALGVHVAVAARRDALESHSALETVLRWRRQGIAFIWKGRTTHPGES